MTTNNSINQNTNAFCKTANNLSDVTAATAKTNLGLGTTDTVRFGAVGIGAAQIQDKLEVSGAIRSSSATANFNAGTESAFMDFTGTVARFGQVNGASGSARSIQILSGGTAVVTITSAGDISASSVSGNQVATQANMETGTATNLIVTPGVQKYHPSASKVWNYVTQSAGTYTQQANFNVSSITKNATGNITNTFTTAFSSANYCAIACVSSGVNAVARCESLSTGSVNVTITNPSTLANVDAAYSINCFGDQ